MISETNCTLDGSKREGPCAVLSEYHEWFSLDDNQRGETDLVQQMYNICSPRGISPPAGDHAECWGHTTI